MFKILFDIILNIVGTLIQAIMWPLNQIIIAAMPDLSDKILDVTTMLGSVFNAITWGLGLLPNSVISVLIFIVIVEIARHTIFVSTKNLVMLWNLIQKLKFW